MLQKSSGFIALFFRYVVHKNSSYGEGILLFTKRVRKHILTMNKRKSSNGKCDGELMLKGTAPAHLILIHRMS